MLRHGVPGCKWLVVALAIVAIALLGSCSTSAPGGSDRIVEVATGHEVSREQLLQAARGSDFGQRGSNQIGRRNATSPGLLEQRGLQAAQVDADSIS